MGTVKYSEVKTSMGQIKFNVEDTTKIYELEVDNYEYLRIYGATNWFKLYINNSIDYIVIRNSEYQEGIGQGITNFVLEDFQINHIKIEIAPELFPLLDTKTGGLEFYLCK